MKKIKLVDIEWRDAWSSPQVNGSPDEIDEMMPPLYRHTVGYLVVKNEDRLVVARDHDPLFLGKSDAYADCAEIPRVLVRKITELIPRPPRRRPDQYEKNVKKAAQKLATTAVKSRESQEPALPPSLPDLDNDMCYYPGCEMPSAAGFSYCDTHEFSG